MADKKIKKKFSNHSGEEQEVNEQFHVRPILWNQPQSNLRLKCLELSFDLFAESAAALPSLQEQHGILIQECTIQIKSFFAFCSAVEQVNAFYIFIFNHLSCL